jgi:hypothetical protein
MGFSRVTKLRRQLLAGWKFALSFRKKTWELEDYPVFLVRQKSAEEETAEFAAVPRFRADVVNWVGLCGTGDSPAAARNDLAQTFKLRRENREPMPRPGRYVPIAFASRDRIDARPDLTADFIQHVLELDWAWISDESSLREFGATDSLEPFRSKILLRYGVDASRVANGRIADILELIDAAQRES